MDGEIKGHCTAHTHTPFSSGQHDFRHRFVGSLEEVSYSKSLGGAIMSSLTHLGSASSLFPSVLQR